MKVWMNSITGQRYVVPWDAFLGSYWPDPWDDVREYYERRLNSDGRLVGNLLTQG